MYTFIMTYLTCCPCVNCMFLTFLVGYKHIKSNLKPDLCTPFMCTYLTNKANSDSTNTCAAAQDFKKKISPDLLAYYTAAAANNRVN